jgi:hypothetical protein
MMKKILDWPERFGPVSVNKTLEKINFQDSLCLFFRTTQGVPIRVEADVDRVEVDDENNDPGIYQMGTTRHYWDNRRNRHLEIVTIDIERYEESFPFNAMRY